MDHLFELKRWGKNQKGRLRLYETFICFVTYLICDPLRELICCNKWHPGTVGISTYNKQSCKDVKTNFHAQDRARNTPIFLSANGEYFWLLSVASSKFGLLTIKRHSAAKKCLFRSPWGDRSGLRRPKMDMHQHQL